MADLDDYISGRVVPKLDEFEAATSAAGNNYWKHSEHNGFAGFIRHKETNKLLDPNVKMWVDCLKKDKKKKEAEAREAPSSSNHQSSDDMPPAKRQRTDAGMNEETAGLAQTLLIELASHKEQLGHLMTMVAALVRERGITGVAAAPHPEPQQ